MIKTGNIFFDFLSFLSLISPLLPAVVIFLKKSYRNDPLNFLMLLCFLSFVRNLLLLIPNLNGDAQHIIKNIFSATEIILLVIIFKNKIFQENKTLANILFTIFVSVIATVYLIKGFAENMLPVEALESAVIIFISILSIARLAGRDDIHIFDDPLFWIAVGSIFYFITDVLVKSLVNLHEKNAEAEISGSRLLLDIANISRYFFYLLASFFYKGAGGEKKDDEFN